MADMRLEIKVNKWNYGGVYWGAEAYVALDDIPLTDTELPEAAAFVYAMRRGWLVEQTQGPIPWWAVWDISGDESVEYEGPTLSQAVQKAREAAGE